MTAYDRFAAATHHAGRPMSLKRRTSAAGGFTISCTVYGKALGFQPNELVGGVVQGDRRIRVAQADIEAETSAGRWPGGPPLAGNTDNLDGAAIMGVEKLHVGSDLVGYAIWVRGGN